MPPEPVEVIFLVTEALESLDIPYMIGGSMASAAYGPVRSTMDVDLIAELKSDHVEQFIQAIGHAFYADVEMMLKAIERRTHFNLIHLVTAFKVDIFIPRDRPFDRQQLGRRVRRTIANEPDKIAFMASPEDIILAKLEWYRLGGE